MFFIIGADRTLEFMDENGTAIAMSCESGDMISVEGELASKMPFDVGTLPVDLPRHMTGLFSISYVLRFQWSQNHVCGSGSQSCTFSDLAPLPERIPAWSHFGILGVDVEAKASAIDGAGLGLFLLRDYPKGGPVTEYDGSLRCHAKVIGKRQATIPNLRTSHWRSLPGCDFVIEGISQHRGLFNGRGGASLANHKAGSDANCKFEIIWTERDCIPRFCEDDGCFHVVPRIILTLFKPARAGMELFVDYGEDTVKRFMDATSPSVLGSVGYKVGECLFHERQFFRKDQDDAIPDGVTPLPVQSLLFDSVL